MDLIVVKPFLGFLVLFGFLYLFALTPILVNGLTDGTCFSNESLPLFQFTPGHYEPEPEDKPLRPERCSSLCSDAEYPLAAIVSQVYCLCGDESAINLLESTANLTAEECDSARNEGTLKVYKGKILHAVSGLNLTVNPSVGFTQEPVNLSVSFKTGVDVQFSFDFGDGSPRTEWNNSRKVSHTYQGSGYFKVKLFARQPAKPERAIVVTSLVVKIVDKIEPVDIDFHCFPVIEPEEDSGCNVTVLAGQDLNATIDFGDSTEPLEFTIPDTRYNPLGPLIYDTNSTTYEEAAYGLYILSDSAKSYSSNSNIRALEGISPNGGDLEMIIYRPWCGNNTPCSLGVVSCSPPKVFCLRDKNCIEPSPKKTPGLTGEPGECRSHIDIFPEYKIARRVLITVTKNYFYYHLSKSRDFRIGDLIALRLYDAKLASESTNSTTNLDLVLNSPTGNSGDPPRIIGYETMKPYTSKKLLVRVITYENSEFYLPHLFADNGNYTAKLTLTSPWLAEVKNFTYDMKIAVQTPIDQIRLRVSPPNAVVGQKVAATIRINGGSDVKLTWDFGDGYATQRKVDFVKLGQKFVESHEFTGPGVYRITAGASNLQNKYATGQTITVQYPITNDWKITSNSPQLLPGTIDLLLTYPVSSNSTEMILPTNASVNILFGDGSTYEWIVPEKWSDLPNGEKIFTHRYKYPGHYKIIATMLNLVSTLTLKTDIFLLRRITGFWLETYALPASKKFSSSESKLSSEVEGKRIDEEQSNSDNTLTTSNRHKLSIGSQVKFTFNQTTGDVDKYIVYLNEKLLKETPNNKFLFTGKKPGWHNFTFYAYNKIQGRTDPVYRNLYFMKPVSGLELLDVSVDVTKPANKILQINLSEIGTDSCVALIYGDSMPFHKSASLFGSVEDCSEGFPNIEAAYYSEINETMIATYEYTGGPGDYVVTAKAWNAVSGTISTQLTITVLEIDCYVPEVIIYNPSTNYSLATQVWKSKPVQLYSLAKVDCNASITVTKYWQCYSINEETGQQGEPIDLSMLDSYRKTVLYVPPFFLSQGLYSFRFVVDLNNLEPHPLLPFSGHASTYVRIVRSPIIGKMTAGAESRAIRGMGQQLKLAPGIHSIDPDDDSNKNFNIVWYCRRLPNEKLFESNENKEEETEETKEKDEKDEKSIKDGEDEDAEDADDEGRSSGRAKGKGKRGGASSEEELAVSNPLWERPAFMEDLGGCFGKGPGRINITEKSIEWPTSVFYAAGFTYEIVVKIDPPDREASWSGIQLVLLERTPPSITIQCQTPSLCYPHVPLGQKINPVRVGLIGVCNEDCDGTLLYEWTIFGIDSVSGEEHLLADAANYVVGSNDVKMALGKEFFDRYYPKYGDFFAKLAVINERGDRGESDIFLHINKPPTGGDCNMTSTGHYALLDKHMINCYNWYDPEFKPIEYYGFWILSKAKGSISFLSYGPERKATLILPPGEFVVGVDIKDKEGALTRHAITNLTLIPPTQQQFDAFMELKQLENADAAGDQSRMSMISQAVSALMNIDLVDETLLEATTTTTTTTTTMKPTTANGTIFAQKSEAKIEEEVKTRSKMFQSVENIMNVDTLNSLETIGSVLSAISGRGKGIDNEAKYTVIRLLNKTVNMASTLQVESPQQLIDFCMFAVGTMGAIVNRMTEQLIKKVVLPTDRSKAWGIEYEVEPPDYGESKDYVFDGKSSVEESLARAVILSERKLGEEQIKQMVGLTIDLVLAILRNIVVGEKPLTFAAPSGLSLTIEMFNGGGLSNKSIQHGDATYIFPEVCSILTAKDTCHGNETMGIMAVSWPSILESFGNSVDLLSEDTQTLQLIVLDEDLRILDVSNSTDYFSIIIPRSLPSDSLVESNEVEGSSVTGHGSTHSSAGLPEGDFIVPKPRKGESMQYHQFLVTKAYSALNIEITPTNPSSRLILFLHYKSKPFLSLHEVSIPLGVVGNQKGSTHDIFLGNSIIANRTGFFYLGIACANESALRDSPYAYLLDDMMIHTNLSMDNSSTTENVTTADWMMRKFDTNYTLRIYTSGCYFFDYSEKIWSGKGCHVATANAHMTHCKCNHLTSFGSGFFIMPNTIDFSYVFANAGFVDNITIYLTVILTLVVYTSLVVWARAADRADLRKLGATPLPDNDPKDKYLYEITVYTGDKEASETDSKVSFILSGDDDETDVRTFSDPERKIFRRGAQDIFVMAVPRKLGRLTYLRIWHDNSGSGKKRSWFMNFIVIRDVQTGEKFEFICNKWFAVEKGDGVIDRLIPVAGLGEATEFSHLFHNKTSKGLKDGHLWFSVFLRPTRSRFTRVQRVSCCMAMLYLSMLVNAMWYEKAPPKPRASALEFGPFTLSPEQIGIGFMSNLIVFPPTFLIVLFFRKSRLRRLRPSRLEETAKRQGIPYKKLTHDSGSASASTVSPIATIDRPSITDSPILGGTISTVQHDPAFGMTSKAIGVGKSKRTMKKPKKQFLFPWWCRYIGWALCVLCMVVSVFFLWAYGVQFGDKKTRQWLTSLVISFFASILITQPIKVFLTAIILSTIFKAPDADVDESEQDEEDIDLELRPDEEWLHDLASMSPHTRRRGGRRAKYYRPPNLTALERAKLERLKEIQMGIILKDIFSYLVFLWLLIVLSYGNRDPNAFLTKDAVKATFIKGANTGTAFTSVSTTESLWEWIEKTLIPELLVGPWYNDYQPYGLRGFLNDRVNRVMGYGVLRSTRIRESTCSMPGTMEKLLKSRAKCRSFGNIVFEDRRSYGKGWTPFNFSSLHTSIHKKGPLSSPPVNSSLAQSPSPDYEEMDMDDAGPLEEGITTKLPGEDIVLVNPSKSKKTPWQYRKPSELDGLPFWGLLDVYSGGGYTIPLKGSRASLLSNLAILKNNSWIDSRTRSVFAEFSAYNPQVNLFTVVTIVAEFQPGGGIVPNYRIDVVRLIRYHQGFGLFVILCELSYVCFIIYFTVREMKKLRSEGLYYFTSYWNWAELFIIICSYVAIGLYIYRSILTHRILKIFDRTHGNGYIKLQYVTFIDELFGYIMAFVIFIGILKFIRLLRFNKRMGLLYSTLHQCSKDLKSFCIVFLIVFFAFVQLFYLLFGTSLPDFSSFINAAETSFGMVTGKFDFEAMVTAAPTLGPLSFFIFVLIAQIVLVNIFLTLIISAFETVKHDIAKQNNEFEMVNFVFNKFKEVLGIDGHGSVHPGSYEPSNQTLSIHEQMKLLPEKVDQFIAHIDDLFYSSAKTGSSPAVSVGATPTTSKSLSTNKTKYTDLMNASLRRSNVTSSTIMETNVNDFYPNPGTRVRTGGRAARRARRQSTSTPQHQQNIRQSGGGILDWQEISSRK